MPILVVLQILLKTVRVGIEKYFDVLIIEIEFSEPLPFDFVLVTLTNKAQ